MKKTLSLSIMLLVATTITWAQQFVADNVKYNVTDAANKKVEVIANDPAYTGAVTVPATVSNGTDTYTVTKVGVEAFKDCSGLTSIVLPDGITVLGKSAFSGCTALTVMNLPASLETIEMDNCFDNCPAMTQYSIAASNAKFSVLDGVLFNKEQTSLVAYPNKKGAVYTTMPATVVNILTSAFSNCTDLTGVTLSPNLKNIGQNAFGGCTALATIVLPDKVAGLGMGAFANCTGLTKVVSKNSTPPSAVMFVFVGANTKERNCKLEVPIGSRDAYVNDMGFGMGGWGADFNPEYVTEVDFSTAVYTPADDSGVRVWTAEKQLHVTAAQPASIYVYNMSGQVVYGQSAPSATAVVSLPKGIYVVKVGKTVVKSIVE